MGLLFNRKKKELKTTQDKLPAIKNNEIPEYFLSVHPKIKDLLWIEDGPYKNWNQNQNVSAFDVMGVTIGLSYEDDDPSLISMKDPVSLIHQGSVGTPGYYPSYKALTPQQKGVYWDFMKNPFNGGFDISYVFILYYGLERHLYQGKYEEAVDVILRLRRVYDNASFQSYSANAIVLTSLVRRRPEFITKLYKEQNPRLDSSLSPDMLLLCKLFFNEYLDAEDLMILAKAFGFSNTNYIKKYPDLFLKELNSVVLLNPIRVADLLNKHEFLSLERVPICIYANYSIKNRELEIPAISKHERLANIARFQLQSAHNAVKEYLKQQRKTGMVVKTIPKKEKKKKVFDEEREQIYKNELFEADGYVSKHYALMHLHEFYYSYRELSPDFTALAEQYALEDISILSLVQVEYKNKNEENRRNYLKENGMNVEQSELDKMFDVTFRYQIPAFKRLCIIYEHEKRIDDALMICDKALEFYSEVGHSEEIELFIKRKNNLQKKI